MEKIFTINHQRVFTLEEANELLPIVLKITDDAQNSVKKFSNQFESLKANGSLEAPEVQKKVEAEVSKWQSKIEKMGLKPKGLWLADFDNGKGYYCWKFPENKITHWHEYQEGFLGRKKIVYENSDSTDQLGTR